ncbi:hypothetical protein [Streptomyces sp. SID9727]|uniref:hypothetical protein n=1 Tax=Streptomyces sp. SID9727 TaxID=2706114 RepID=UPI0013CA4943|nr:hypothetical protein [Streptomyces sp. SID9727]NEC64662.1 hypothetical protein [Streptomyces sp. SID9727]
MSPPGRRVPRARVAVATRARAIVAAPAAASTRRVPGRPRAGRPARCPPERPSGGPRGAQAPEPDRLITETRTLRNVVADCLACGCTHFDNCRLLA